MSIQITYYKADSGYCDLFGVELPDSADIPKNFSNKGELLEGNSLVLNQEVAIVGCKPKSMIKRVLSNKIKVELHHVGINEPVKEQLHLLVGNYLLIYKVNDLEWFGNTKFIEYRIDHIYDAKNSPKAKIIKTIGVNDDGLDNEEISLILEECTEIV